MTLRSDGLAVAACYGILSIGLKLLFLRRATAGRYTDFLFLLCCNPSEVAVYFILLSFLYALVKPLIILNYEFWQDDTVCE